VAAPNKLRLVDTRGFGERGRRRERADAHCGLGGQGDLSDQSRCRGERYDKFAKHEMHPPNGPILDAPLERRMNGGAVLPG
jgi:hypothetical protein